MYKAHPSKIPSSAEIGEGVQISPTAIVGENVRLGDGVKLGPYVVIGDRVQIDANSFVGAHCVIGDPGRGFFESPESYEFAETVIGSNAIIRSGSIISEGVKIGTEFQSGSRISIQAGSRIGDNCSIGTQSDVQASVQIGDFSRLHSNVHLTAGAQVGKYVWIMPGVIFTNDNAFPTDYLAEPPIVEHYTAIGAACLIFPGVKLGMHVVVSAGSKVKGEHEAGSFLHGDPAKRVCDIEKFFLRVGGRTVFPYPWPKHVERNYPWKDVPPEKRSLEDYI